jgi:hypothetical protein
MLNMPVLVEFVLFRVTFSTIGAYERLIIMGSLDMSPQVCLCLEWYDTTLWEFAFKRSQTFMDRLFMSRQTLLLSELGVALREVAFESLAFMDRPYVLLQVLP